MRKSKKARKKVATMKTMVYMVTRTSYRLKAVASKLRKMTSQLSRR